MKSEEKTKRLAELDDMARYVTQEKGTEQPFSGKYVNERSDGTYHCVVCGQKLFESGTKFDSGTG